MTRFLLDDTLCHQSGIYTARFWTITQNISVGEDTVDLSLQF